MVWVYYIAIMANELTDKIRNTLRIEDVIGRTVSLRKTHRGYSGLCPFHDDKAPSFHVYTDSQSYYCFGCHESGDIFTFVMKTQSLTFSEAVSVLAQEAGIDPAKFGHQSSRKGAGVYDVLNMAQEYFTSCMARLPGGKGYLSGRGITAEDCSRFGLGYAPDSWDDLMNVLARKNVDARMMLDAGLVVQGERGMYDRFRGRVTFPVRDIAGRIVAFGGRAVVGDTGAKYINSPESSVYSKRRNLYLLDMAGSVMREKGYGILCEGYMDAIRLHKAGFRESVASLGTSLTAEQAELLKRFADRCYICYDGDSAGQKAALRGMYILAASGLDVLVVRLPDGLDPDDYLRANPPESFQKALDEALPLIPYHIESLRPELDDPLRRKKAARELWDGVRSLPPDDALQYIASLSAAFRLPAEEVSRRILDREADDVPEPQEPKPQHESIIIDNELECAFCSMLARSRECRLNVNPAEILGLITNPEARITAEAVLSDGSEDSLDMWRTVGDTGKLAIISRGNIFVDGMKSLQEREKWEHVYSGLERMRILRRVSELNAKFSANTATSDDMEEFSELQRKLRGLKI